MQTALDYLAAEGNAKLRVDQIAAALGVTKGSFYAHFTSREDFMMSVVRYWDEEYTRRVKRMVEEQGGSARDRLRGILNIVTRENLARYDIAISSWAAHEPAIAPMVNRDYEFRLRYVRSLFSQMGFRGESLNVRTQAFVGFMTFRGAFSAKGAEGSSSRRVDAWQEFFTRR